MHMVSRPCCPILPRGPGRLRNSLKYADHFWLCLVKNHIVNLEISMDERPDIPGLRLWVLKEGHGVFEMRYIAYRLFCLHIDRLSL